jgi:hypothetical protein
MNLKNGGRRLVAVDSFSIPWDVRSSNYLKTGKREAHFREI